MTANGILQILILFGLVLACVKPLGLYMARVFARERTFLDPVLAPIERLIYRLSGVRPDVEQHWTTYTIAMLLFNVAGLLLLYAIQRLQGLLPLQPAGTRRRSRADSSFNTAVSFTTNTNWQSYVARVDDELLHPDGRARVPQLRVGGHGHRDRHRAGPRLRAPRGRRRSATSGWTSRAPRSTCCCRSRRSSPWCWSAQGVPQNLNAYTPCTTVEGADQTIAQGPVASQEAIKELGTNGGGFFNANSAHPFENPTPLTNFLEMFAIFADPARRSPTPSADGRRHPAGLGALRRDAGDPLLTGVVRRVLVRSGGQPAFAHGHRQSIPRGGNMEGKEVRFGIADSRPVRGGDHRRLLRRRQQHARQLHAARRHWFRCSTSSSARWSSAASGAGLYGMLVFAMLAVFIAGLMVGRTPEYLGKKIEANEVKMADAGHPHPRVLDPRLHRAGERHRPPGSPVALNNAGRTASARSSTPTPRAPATTAAPLRASPRTLSSTT